MSNIIPPALVRKLSEDPLFNTEDFLGVHQQSGQETSIRVNPKKKHVSTADFTPVPWCADGFYLPSRPVFTLDPLFHAGAYYVQEASSMFVAQAIKSLELEKEPLIALDLCAAPGGKSTLLNSCLHDDSLLVANEIIKTRVNILTDNLIRWGNANTVITNNDPYAFKRLPGYFDLMVVDAPCSGSGMFRKDGSAIDEWSLAAVKLCSERQQRILADSVSALKTGGILVYSTCSYSKEENEDIADWLCESEGFESIRIPIDAAWGIVETRSEQRACFGYRFYPHLLRGEGFFLAAFRKTGNQSSFPRKKVKLDKLPDLRMPLAEWIANAEGFATFTLNEEAYAFPRDRILDLQILRNVLYLKNAGTRAGKLLKTTIVPSHDLAMSNHLRPDIPKVELSLTQAQDYLRKTNIDPTVNIANISGWALASFQHVPLGWMKLMPQRINNYFPKEWRITNL